ncbi:MAG: murein L,D-transpeptidase [Alphaproteobacteria bacterium]|nr:MAG: murein L,D-transpeptidase [Alphaproteobacteria bacterium]
MLSVRIKVSLSVLALAIGLIPQAPATAQEAVIESSAVLPAAAQTVTPVLSAPLKGALRRARLKDEAVDAFYAGRDSRPFWTAGTGAWARALLRTIEASDRHGLAPSRYHPARLRKLLAAGGPEAEAAFMKAYLAFGRDISSGQIAPRSADREIHIPLRRPASQALLSRLRGSPPGDFFGLAPQTKEYAKLVAELARVRKLVERDAAIGKVPRGRLMRLGTRSRRVLALRKRLAAVMRDRLGANDSSILGRERLTATIAPEGDAEVYDATLEAAVKEFQTRSRLKPDGVVGPATLAALNASAADRYGQILVNLERIRWLHRDPEERHIFVNQADFSMEFMDRGRLVLDSRVIVGKRGHETPEFIDEMDHMIVNPSWHVPVSIATKEILPRLKKDPSYLARHNMQIVPRGRHPVPDGVTTDYSQYSVGNFPFSIRQRPSARNALGRVKFMFPNQFSVYLHDTPTKRLFERDVRAFSHGCVRVQRPFDLAYALLQGQVDDPEATFKAWLRSGRERRVDLKRTVKVYLTYRTVFVDRNGDIQYRADIYGRDARVLKALRAVGVDSLS